MSIAAVPAYLGQDFKQASTGLRFGMYLKLWGVNERTRRALWGTHDVVYRVLGRNREERELREENKVPAINAACALSQSEKEAMEAISARQKSLAVALPDCFALPAQSTAPFVTGMGNEHPLENGFSFLWPYGLPYLPGSGIKGVLRQAVRELAKGMWGETRDWSIEKCYSVRHGKETIKLSMTDLLFGLESEDRQTEHFRGVLSFWDVIPEIRGDKLMVEIMTPHQTHYYRDGQQPHDSGQPTPISFLTVPPGSGFTFHVQCDLVRLTRLAPELVQNDHWKTLLESAFAHAFDWLGFGAKTAVGYGAMRIDKEAQQTRREQAAARQEEEAKQAELAAAIADLPGDASQIERWRAEPNWEDTSRFLELVEPCLSENEELSPQACQRLHEEMNKRWPGIMENPEATQGKKKKPKYKPRPKELALRILKRCADK